MLTRPETTNRQLQPQAGFTLVEVLVVLVLLGVIISLAISRLSAPLTEATIKKSTFQIAQDMQTISDAGQYYITDKNAVLTADAGGTWKTEIRTGMLTSIPNPPSDAKAAGFAGTYGYDLNAATYNGYGSTTTTDTVIFVDGLADEVCKKINETYAGTTVGSAIPAAIDYTKDLQCFASGGNNRVTKPIFPDRTKTS